MDSDSDSLDPDVRVERAEFDGVLIAVLAYGALLMLYMQLLRVLLTRPKRGRVFLGITLYSGLLIALATIAVGGKIKYAEFVYVGSRFTSGFSPSNMDSWIPSYVFQENSGSPLNVMSQICTSLTPWIGDAFMIYRLMVVWGYQWWLLLLPLPLCISHIGMSIPFLIAYSKATQAPWQTKSLLYDIVFHALCVGLNIVISVLIAVRLLTMRRKLSIAMGKLQASFYTSWLTVIVESGAFATLWGIVYLATRASNHWSQSAFLQPYYYVIAITRMLIVLKMAQNRAWSRDIVSAANMGIMDWEVSSSHSLPPNDTIPTAPDLKKIMTPNSSAASTDTHYVH